MAKPTRSEFEAVLDKVKESPLRGRELRQFAMGLLDGFSTYDWSGIYVLQGDMLHLDAFCGAPTDHVEIPVGRGVCGTAVAENANQVIEDVRSLDNYLSCSAFTRSEIVVLIHREGGILGQIDIDGHQIGAFDEEDEQFLMELAAQLAGRWD